MQYHQSLITAVKDAMRNAREQQDNGEIDAINHLSAQRRDHGDGEYTWLVYMGDEFADFATHMTDNIHDLTGSANDVAAFIEMHWNEEWDDLQVANPVGDYSYGSSDWKQRDQ